MKKLAIVFAAIACATAVHAATFSWATYTGQYVYQAGTSTKLSGATAYLFDASAVSQATLLQGLLVDSKSITDFTALASGTTSTAGALSKTEFTASTATGDTLTAYFAIVSGDDVFISTEASGAAQATSTTALSFKSLNTPSKAAALEYAGSYSGAGWYTAVPEPTSGLLMLLGMAGLALKRKRA